MKLKSAYTLLFLILLVLVACEDEFQSRMVWTKGSALPKIEITKDSLAIVKSIASGRLPQLIEFKLEDRPEKVWAQTSTTYFFSDTAQKDKFSLKIIGDKDFTAQAYLTIRNYKDDLLFADSFPLIDILSIKFDGGGYYATQTKEEEFIQQYAQDFFNENHFQETKHTLKTDSNNQVYFSRECRFNYTCSKQNKFSACYSPNEKFVYKKAWH